MSNSAASASVALALIAASVVISTSIDASLALIAWLQSVTYLSIIFSSFAMLKMFIYSEKKIWETISEHAVTTTVIMVSLLIIGDTLCQTYQT